MGIAHVCVQCGTGLARTRAALDPHYQLPIVRCPDCGMASVRRLHPIVHAWRNYLRIQRAWLALLGQLLVLGALTLGTVWIASALRDELIRIGVLAVLAERRYLLSTMLIISVLTGIWLTAGLDHWKRGRASLAWGVWCALGLGVASALPRPVEGWIRSWLAGVAILLIMITLSKLGGPLGHRLLEMLERGHASRWRRRRRRYRMRRGRTG